MKANNIEELFGTLQQSVVEEWRSHLKTSKYSKHEALDDFYKEMPELIDAFIEDYMGHTKTKVDAYINILKAEDFDALQYLEELHEICQSGYELIPEDAPELKSDLDAIKSKIDTTMYKLRELKESSMKSLVDFIKESIVNEARVVFDKLDDKDLVKHYYDEWSGFNTKGPSGETRRSQAVYAQLEKRFGGDDAYYIGDILVHIDTGARKEVHLGSFAKINEDVRNKALDLIDEYWDDIIKDPKSFLKEISVKYPL